MTHACRADPHLYIFTWLNFYGGILASIAGVLVADYWLLRRGKLRLSDLYRMDGAYRYTAGWNPRAVIAMLVGG